jgi:DeoR family transcriptional regulator, suf operon transcriptional repressor
MIAAMGTATPSVGTTPVKVQRHGGLRGAILLELKRAQRSTAKDLACRLSVSLNAVRHHLKELEAQALVEYERRHQGVGAPAFAYRLTPTAEALFPRHYEATLNELLDHGGERDGRAAAVSVLEARYATLTRRLQGELAGVPPTERMAAVARLLTDEGYMAEASGTTSSGILVEHNCAIQAVAERFPEICAAEARFLAAVLGAEVHRQEHILSGCSACEYRVRFISPGEEAAPHARASVVEETPVAPPPRENV